MLIRSVIWRCDKCRKVFRTRRDAEGCEMAHIVTEAGGSFRAALDAILNSEPKDICPRPRRNRERSGL